MRERLEQLVEKIGAAKQLDSAGDALAKAVNAAIEPTPVKNALNGSWLGHPVHPLLVAFPIGSWSAALAFDLLPSAKGGDAADLLIALGLVTAVPTAATGLANWSDLFGADKRIGLVHAAANVTATTLFALSLIQRRRGRRASGRLLVMAGLGATSAGGWLGGHLTYRRGAGVDHTAFQEAAADWTTVAKLSELPEGKGHAADVDGVPVLLVRDGANVLALADVCTHAGGPLHEGEIADGCVTCPWHGSQFRLANGEVVRSPATSPQPVYETRITGDDVQIKQAG